MEFLKMRGLEIAFYQPRFLLFIDRDGSVRIMTSAHPGGETPHPGGETGRLPHPGGEMSR